MLEGFTNMSGEFKDKESSISTDDNVGPKIGDIWYRYEDFLESNGCDEWGESLGGHIAVRLCRFKVQRVTPKGVRLDNGTVVIESHTKKYACPTLEQAKESFYARKRRQASIHQTRARHALEAVAIVKTGHLNSLQHLAQAAAEAAALEQKEQGWWTVTPTS